MELSILVFGCLKDMNSLSLTSPSPTSILPKIKFNLQKLFTKRLTAKGITAQDKTHCLDRTHCPNGRLTAYI